MYCRSSEILLALSILQLDSIHRVGQYSYQYIKAVVKQGLEMAVGINSPGSEPTPRYSPIANEGT
jgi:hypothetical protein